MKSEKWWLTKKQKEKDIKNGVIRDSEGRVIKDGRIESATISDKDIENGYKYDPRYVKKPSCLDLSSRYTERKSREEAEEEAKERREQIKLEEKLKKGKANE